MYAGITIALMIMAVGYFTPNKLEKIFRMRQVRGRIRNKKDNIEKSQTMTCNSLFFIAIALLKNNRDGDGIVAGVV